MRLALLRIISVFGVWNLQHFTVLNIQEKNKWLTDRTKAIYSQLNFINNLTLSGCRVKAVLVFEKIISSGIFQLMKKKLSKATSIHLTANCE